MNCAPVPPTQPGGPDDYPSQINVVFSVSYADIRIYLNQEALSQHAKAYARVPPIREDKFVCLPVDSLSDAIVEFEDRFGV